MANEEHLKILKQGVEAWNEWREKNPEIKPDLIKANLIEANLYKADLNGANLSDADLTGADLYEANLHGADLTDANLTEANLRYANLTDANLTGARLFDANLRQADLTRADATEAVLTVANLRSAILTETILTKTIFVGANLHGADLTDADLSQAVIGGSTFASVDLSKAKNLDTLQHDWPSTVGIDTIYLSKGNIPQSFLVGAGVPDDFITYMKSLVGQAIEFYSCFISYSHEDEEFTKRLHSRMRDEGLRTWYAPEDVRGGRKIHEQIDEAIRLHDKLLIVLSENSMQSEWVITEIRKARQKEIKAGRRVLFPIRLVDVESIKAWECFDVDTGKDLAVEIREYHIPDFQNWKIHDAFEAGFKRLLRDLTAEESK